MMMIARMILAVLTVTGLSLVANAEDKKTDIKKLVVGKWEAVKADEGSLPVGSTVEMSADGKLTVEIKKGGKDVTHAGTYVVEGDGFSVTFEVKGKEQKQKITVKKISDKEMSTTNEQGKSAMFKKVK